jgi:SSS family solute:Na+ symporter
VLAFAAVLGAVSLLALVSRRRHDPAALPSLEGWGLADRRMGTAMTWCLVGGAIYTAYTFVAVPGLVYGIGALGFFAVPYTIVFYSLAFLVLPRLWAIAARNGYVTTADVVRGRFGSPALALCVALTGLLATMPYVALQLLGLRALLTALGLPAEGVAGDCILTAVFATLAVATYRSGPAGAGADQRGQGGARVRGDRRAGGGRGDPSRRAPGGSSPTPSPPSPRAAAGTARWRWRPS